MIKYIKDFWASPCCFSPSITRMKILGAIGGGFLLLTALARFFIDLKTDNLPWKKERKIKELKTKGRG